MKPAIFHPEAFAELESASDRYEEQRAGLGQEFEVVIRESLVIVGRSPKAFSPHGETGVRKFFPKRFPYTIFYIELEEAVWVAALARHGREPDYWAARLDDAPESSV